ncbi:MAG TPA: DUF4369 domain-containing protein [Sphingobacterium sp.]|nr:DUF4369 domain-containing protein [Sphingobacterium sp.]
MRTFRLRIFLTALSMIFVVGTYAQEDFTLKGKIGNWSSPAKIFIDYKDNGNRIIDSVEMDKGAFEYHGKLAESTTATLRLSPDGSSFDQPQYHYESSMILYPGIMEIKGDDLVTATKNVTITTVTTTTTTTTKDRNININIGGEKEDKSNKFPRAFGGITFSRIDWGFSRLINDGSFNLSAENQFLDYKKASNFGFDVLQAGLRFNDNFKTYLAVGFEWNYLRFKNNILLTEDISPLEHTVIDANEVDYKKNVFTSTYLRLPLSFEWRSDHMNADNLHRVKVNFGLMTGVLLKGTQRLKSDKLGKQKFKDNYSLSTFQYGPFLRFGYHNYGFFAKYYVNDMFENSPTQEGLNNFTFGLTLGF